MRTLSAYELDLVAGGSRESEITVIGHPEPDPEPPVNDTNPDGAPPSGGGGGSSQDPYNANNFHTTAEGADLAELERAIDYLAMSQEGRAILDWAKANDITIKIDHGNRDSNRLDTKEITWDPYGALHLKDDAGNYMDRYQSAALGLMHEILHIYYAANFTGFGPSADPKWHTVDEQYIIQHWETTIANELGEPIRTNHFGDSYDETDSVQFDGPERGNL